MIPTLPLVLRNRLAATILGALHDADARRELTALAGATTRGWLGEHEAQWQTPLVERARAASRAVATLPLFGHDLDVIEALAAAAVLFDAALYFEVHELLEPHWVGASGQTREALQGLIQVAVGYQHLANGNRAGARSLLAEGSARLHGARLAGLDVEPFARAAAESAAKLTAGEPVTVPPFPREE